MPAGWWRMAWCYHFPLISGCGLRRRWVRGRQFGRQRSGSGFLWPLVCGSVSGSERGAGRFPAGSAGTAVLCGRGRRNWLRAACMWRTIRSCVSWRVRWRAHQHRLDPGRLIFIDETRIKTQMTRTRGWSPRGTRLTAHLPHGHCKTLTFLAGMRHGRIVAPFLLDGPINGDAFTAWVGQSLAPTLAPGDIVIADNLGSHRPARPPTHSERRSASAVPAALQPGPHPRRDGLRQTQGAVPQGRRAHDRNLVATGRPPA